MWKKNKFFILAFVGLLAIGFIESQKPEPTIWVESYSKYDKIPYGNFVLFEELGSIFTQGISTSKLTPSKALQDSSSGNMIFINHSFEPSEEDLKAVMDFVAHGNQVLVASRHITDRILDTLSLSTQFEFSISEDTLSVQSLIGDPSTYYGATYNIRATTYFDSCARAEILGHVSDSLPNFISLKHGEGQLFLHLLPSAFTNVFMLNENNHQYISQVLSYLPDEPTLWDEYYKARKAHLTQSPLKEILKKPGLRQSLYLTVLGALVYTIFASKRKQRVIPILPAKTNSTVEFIDTMGQLYYNEGSHKEIGEKRIKHFMSDMRERYRVDTNHWNESLIKKLSALSGVPEQDVADLIHNFRVIQTVQEVLDDRLVEQERLIDNFYKKEGFNGK